jgi:predicted DNA-binding protein (MmcQ/YjbR family)
VSATYSRAWLDAAAMALPGTYTDVKWTDDLCYCLAGKLFCITSVDGDAPGFTVKTPPDVFAALVARPGFAPAPYLARYHWVAVRDPGAVSLDELADLIRGSWALVRAKLPRRVQDDIPLP